MLKDIKRLLGKNILNCNFGIEREGLRVNLNGELSKTPHPDVFGFKIFNPYITTDFSESQLELITPTFKTSKEVYNFSNALYDIVSFEIKDEYIWPQSMPCIIPSEDKEIPIASYCGCEQGKIARKYREELLLKYGGKKQLISGIHYNFSFNESVLERLYENSEKSNDYKTFKNNIYLKIARNYLRYRWLLVYLFGCTGTLHESYDCDDFKDECSEALSFRNSDCGYKNNINLFPDYSSIESYYNSINKFIEEGFIDSHKELYSSVRIKSKDSKDFSSLLKDGVYYLEYRSIDINPFEKGGISLDDLEFLSLFNIFLLIQEESDYTDWQKEALINQNNVALRGQYDISLLKDGSDISKNKWALDILNSIKVINDTLELEKGYFIDKMIDRVNNYKNTYNYKMIEKVKNEGYIEAHLDLAKKHKKASYDNRFKLEGYEDLELSTQILMKEAIKRGIKTEVLDRDDNFICLSKTCSVDCNEDIITKTEYVKQATKTSKDNYVTVLAMENKVVTKRILEKNNINIPNGKEFNSKEDVLNQIDYFINKPLVIKPKSTNFGLGISIFPKGAKRDDILSAFDIAFKYDTTILVEDFIKGKEYRFLVIGDKVCGVLHRVPANVVGDGINSIEELVDIKNRSSLRGKGYKTPLEKIELDENARLFLKHKGLDFNYIPKKDEIVYLRENSNISTGGDSIDYTDDMPNKFKDLAIKSSKSIGANICGVDMMIEDFKDKNSNYVIIELNFNPAIHIHSYPYIGKERNIAKEILKILGLID